MYATVWINVFTWNLPAFYLHIFNFVEKVENSYLKEGIEKKKKKQELWKEIEMLKEVQWSC